jgi:LuxR family maltose regulon positive regulatory protein
MEKMIPIELPEICAPRTELLGMFDHAAGKRCIYINAPGGCGKTVSTLLWLKKSGLKTIWLGLDIYDNSLSGFYRFFCTAFFSVIPQEETLVKVMKDPGFNTSPVEYTIEVLSQFSFEDCRYALVLDDFHLITNEEIIKSLTYVIKRLPLSVTVIILSRGELPQAFCHYEESGKIAFISASEFAFRSDEIRKHFASFGRFITAREAEDVFDVTEGWAIAVNAVVMGGNTAADENLKNNPLRKYIKTQIWDKLEESLRRFMLQTSIADKFSAELCEQITENTESRELLEMLLSDNMFLSRQEGEYRYHHLFLDFLREEADREASLDLQSLSEKAADYYLCTGNHFNALRYYLRSGISKGIADAIYRFLKFNVQSSSEMSKIYFINKLPAETLEANPVLYVSCAWCALLFSGAENLFYYLDKIYERIRDIVAENKAFLEVVIFLYTADPRYTFTEQLSKLQAAAPLEVDPRNVPKTISYNLPYFHRTYRDYSHYALNTEKNFDEFRLVFSPLLGNHYSIVESGIRAGLLYEKSQIKDSLQLVERNPDTDSAELVFLSKMHISACLYAMGRSAEAAQCRNETEIFLRKERLLYLLPIFSAYETKLKLLDGDKAAAKAWLDNYFITEVQNPELRKIFLHFTTVRAFIVLGEYEKASILCKKIWKLCIDFHRLLDAAEAAVLMTVLEWLACNKQEASARLQKTLSDMEPYGYIRVFADEGKAILPVLKRLLKKTEEQSVPGTPGGSFVKEVYLAAYEQSKRYKGIAFAAELKQIKLSGQQKYMLELLAKGYRNADIVELTGLSINTVRYHTKEAYLKLEVTNAMDAVLRARALGLIH